MLYNITQLPKNLSIGYIGETQFRTFEFDLNPWLEIIPDGVGSIVHIRPGETKDDAYICATTWQDGILSWTVNAGDLGATEGYGLLQIWLVGSGPERRGKSAILQTIIQASVNSASSDVPSAQQAWMEQMTSLKTETVTAAGIASTAKTDAETAKTDAETAKTQAENSAEAAASSAAHFPRIHNGYWEVWDGASGAWVNTGVAATGATPDLEIGTVTTLAPDQQAYVQIAGTDENPVLNFGIPRGRTGSVDEVYGTTVPVSESDSRTVKQVLDLKLETVDSALDNASTNPVQNRVVASAISEVDNKLISQNNLCLDLSAIKSYLLSVANAMSEGETRLVMFMPVGAFDTFKEARYSGFLTLQTIASEGRYFEAIVSSSLSDVISFGYYGGAWNISAISDYIANLKEGILQVSNADDAPLGLSFIAASDANAPFPFWATLHTVKGNLSNYMQQIAYSWAAGENRLAYRVKDSGVWGNWHYYNDGSDVGIVERGDTATHAIPAGYYVIWKGSLYKANSAIPVGETLSSYLSAVSNGLGAEVASLNSNIGSFRTFTYNISASSDAECLSVALADILTRMTEGVFIARITRTNAWSFICYGLVNNNVATVECFNEYNGNLYIYKKQSGQDITLVATLQKQVVRQSVTTTITVPASNIYTNDISIASAPSNLLVIAGYEIASATGILVEQIYISNASTIHYRLQNENTADTTCTITVYYI